MRENRRLRVANERLEAHVDGLMLEEKLMRAEVLGLNVNRNDRLYP